MICHASSSERGYALLGVMLLVGVAAFIVASSHTLNSTSSRAVVAERKRSSEYYAAESTMHAAIGWMRSNSTSMALPFARANFYTLFNRSSTPGTGTNDSSTFSVPTKIKLQSGGASGLLHNSSTLGTANFPSTTDTVSGSLFAADTSFSSGSFGTDLVRITLVDAIATDSTKDYGDTDAGNPTPDTDFNPIYRVDSMKSLTSGAHVFGYLVGTLVSNYGVGFYGRDFVDVQQDCDSYISNNGVYNSSTNKKANCSIGSNSDIKVKNSTKVYGSGRSNGVLTTTPPYGGSYCADFASGCPNPGSTCAGTSCQVPGLPSYSSWSTYCSTDQGNVTISPSATLSSTGNAASQKCWNTVTVPTNKRLTLTSTSYPYFFKTLDLANNSDFLVSPSPSTGTVNLYVENLVGNKINGNQALNTLNKPYQLRIHYLGTNDIVVNGNSAMGMFIVAPYAGVTLSGNSSFSGGIKAKSLTMTGSATVHYDESGDITTVSDVSYKIRNVEERYR